jgi:multiple sugar transport system substrate-binding protein
MKKKISVILVCVILALSLAACGGPGSSDGFSGRTIEVGIWGGNDTEMASIEQVRLDFMELTGAIVEFRHYTDYNTQIQADFIAGTAPDAFYVDVNMFPFFDSINVLEPLDRAAVNADAFFKNLTDGFVGASGSLYAVPKDFSTLAMYVNTDILAETGFTLQDIPSSWEGFIEFAPRFQEALDATYGADSVAALSYNLDLARNLHLLNRGASVIGPDDKPTLDTPGVAGNFQLLMDLTATGAVHRPADIGTGWNGEAFGLGRVAIMEEGNWVYGYLNNEFDINFTVINMPSYKGDRSSMIFTVGYGVYSQSQNKDLALEWVKFATGLEGMSTWAGPVGVLPSRQDVADNINISADPALQMHLEQVQFAIPWKMGLYAPIINDQYQNFMIEAITGSMSVADALKAAQEQALLQIG